MFFANGGVVQVQAVGVQIVHQGVVDRVGRGCQQRGLVGQVFQVGGLHHGAHRGAVSRNHLGGQQR